MSDFIAFVNDLKNGYSFGNNILYTMCNDDFEKFNVPNHLGDKIWLIGRAYSASPERRTYGFERDDDGKALKDDNGNRVPLYKPVTAADGKGSFFASIAENMINDNRFGLLCGLISELKNASFNCDEIDIAVLAKSVYAVSLLNELIRCASEAFDGLYAVNDKRNKSDIRCKNQISFCSKFLHFHCPQTVFIIDQYSLCGGESLVTYEGKKRLYIDKDNSDVKEYIDEGFIKELRNSSDYNQVLQRLRAAYEKLVEIDDNAVGAGVSEKDDNTVDNYFRHCARGYFMICYLKKQGIPAQTRLIDDIFLRVKRE